MFWKIFAFCLFCATLQGEIVKIDEEDMRNLRASNPIALFLLPTQYAFSQAAQTAKEQGYRYFSPIYYECNLHESVTKAFFDPPEEGVLLDYEDEWIRIDLYAYFDPPDSWNVFDTNDYLLYLCDQEIDLHPEDE